PESLIYYGKPAGQGRWFFYYVLLLTAMYALVALGAWFAPAGATVPPVAAVAPLALTVVGLLLLVVLRLTAGRAAMARVWLAGGNGGAWWLLGLGFVGFSVVQGALNAALGLGRAQLVPLPAPPSVNPTVILIAGAVQSVLLAPLLAILLGFGEEYGWRGYL